ncbi:MAG: hypothetical protein WC125_08695 [Bacteroidales bacterium]
MSLAAAGFTVAGFTVADFAGACFAGGTCRSHLFSHLSQQQALHPRGFAPKSCRIYEKCKHLTPKRQTTSNM